MSLSFKAVRKGPLPLLKPRDSKQDFKVEPTDKRTGILLLTATVSVFFISMLALFDLITIPSFDPDNDFPIANYYTHAVLLVPVGAWIWSVIAWTGLKLFKHAKGGAVNS